MNIHACMEHVDVAIDTIVDECEIAPEIKELNDDEKLSTACEYCQNTAIYLVSNTYSDTICG
ncbi:CxxH/CxxC protein [Bacillus salitolerans]|uniref:CxxH/CxxC protein n=1 Tax=Bacillus salitolerans TaxID=1437434 RepID=A0ABW4LJQ2_9BACI